MQINTSILCLLLLRIAKLPKCAYKFALKKNVTQAGFELIVEDDFKFLSSCFCFHLPSAGVIGL